MKNWNAYHFVGGKLPDGRAIPANGVKLIHHGELELCRSGLHASKNAFDALKYAPGHTLCRVFCEGDTIYGVDKLGCTERTIIERVNAEKLLFKFARMCALDVVHLWDAPDVVVAFLKTGDEKLRADSWAASLAAPGAASRSASGAASRNASGAASWAASGVAWWAASGAASGKKQRNRFVRMVNDEFRRLK